MAPGKGGGVERELGRLDAKTEAHDESITDLRRDLKELERRLTHDATEWRLTAEKYKRELNRSKWFRRGQIAAYGTVLAMLVWAIERDSPVLKEVLLWLIGKSHSP